LIDFVVNKLKALIESGSDGLTDPNVNGRTGGGVMVRVRGRSAGGETTSMLQV
jgi:hypothetical protein